MTTELISVPVLLKHKPQFKKAVYNANMKALPEMIEGTMNLFKRYSIKWVPGSTGHGAYVPAPLLSLAKGKNKDDLGKRIKEAHTAIATYFTNKGQLIPFMKKLVGKELDNFKQIWLHYIGEDLGKINSLWVVEWSVAYLYLSSGLTIASLTPRPTVEYKPRVKKRVSTKMWDGEYDFSRESEVDLVAKIAHLSLYQKTLHVTLEETVQNIYKGSSTVKTRRFDLAIRNFLNRDINHVEFKLDPISVAHVHLIVGERNYLDLIRNKYKGRTTNLIFSSPHGCTPEALRYIKSIRGCSYMDTQEIIGMIIRNIELETPVEGWWYYIREVLPRIFRSQKENILSFHKTQNEKCVA